MYVLLFFFIIFLMVDFMVLYEWYEFLNIIKVFEEIGYLYNVMI